MKEGDWVSFDGLSGEVKIGQVATKPSEILQVVGGEMKPEDSDIYQRFATILSWTDKVKTLGIRANADLPDQAELAYAFGARGIGLCRTEHMFFGEGRIPIVQQMILADNEADRRKALDQLLPLQRDDFYGVFKAMHGSPVTIRMIDPPLHEFLPKREDLMVEIAKLEAAGKSGKELAEKKALLHRVEQLHEFNPMMGHRGVRLGITYPEITEMQTKAIISAACQLTKEGHKVVPEIMIPLVGHVKELRDQKAVVDRVAAETMKEYGVKVKYLVGTMIEVPRGAVTADEVAKEAQFFSFGTNDLTQLTFGFSRDDAGKFLAEYQRKKILERDPFQSLDTTGVGQLVQMACGQGAGHASGHQARRLRRARRRPVVDPLLPEGGPRLRQHVALSRAGRAPRGGAGGDVGQGRRLSDVQATVQPAPEARERQGRGRPTASCVRRFCARRSCATCFHIFVSDGRSTRQVERVDPAWLKPGSGVYVWVDLASPTEDEARILLGRLPLPRARHRGRAQGDSDSQGRVLRRLSLSDPARHRLRGGAAPLRDPRGRHLPRRAVPRHRARRFLALGGAPARGLSAQRLRARRGARRAAAPHRRLDGRQLSARGRQARGAARSRSRPRCSSGRRPTRSGRSWR